MCGPGKWLCAAAAAFGAGVLIGGLLRCPVGNWLCGLGLIAAGLFIIRR